MSALPLRSTRSSSVPSFTYLSYKILTESQLHLGGSKNEWKAINKPFCLCFIDRQAVINGELILERLRYALMVVGHLVSTVRRTSLLFVNGIPEPESELGSLCRSDRLLRKLGYGYVVRWMPGYLSNLPSLIMQYWRNVPRLIRRHHRSKIQQQILRSNYRGMRILTRFPDLVCFFSASGPYESAVREVLKLGVPAILFGDTDATPTNSVAWIPSNDDHPTGLYYQILLFRELLLRALKDSLFKELPRTARNVIAPGAFAQFEEIVGVTDRTLEHIGQPPSSISAVRRNRVGKVKQKKSSVSVPLKQKLLMSGDGAGFQVARKLCGLFFNRTFLNYFKPTFSWVDKKQRVVVGERVVQSLKNRKITTLCFLSVVVRSFLLSLKKFKKAKLSLVESKLVKLQRKKIKSLKAKLWKTQMAKPFVLVAPTLQRSDVAKLVAAVVAQKQKVVKKLRKQKKAVLELFKKKGVMKLLRGLQRVGWRIQKRVYKQFVANKKQNNFRSFVAVGGRSYVALYKKRLGRKKNKKLIEKINHCVAPIRAALVEHNVRIEKSRIYYATGWLLSALGTRYMRVPRWWERVIPLFGTKLFTNSLFGFLGWLKKRKLTRCAVTNLKFYLSWYLSKGLAGGVRRSTTKTPYVSFRIKKFAVALSTLIKHKKPAGVSVQAKRLGGVVCRLVGRKNQTLVNHLVKHQKMQRGRSKGVTFINKLITVLRLQPPRPRIAILPKEKQKNKKKKKHTKELISSLRVPSRATYAALFRWKLKAAKRRIEHHRIRQGWRRVMLQKLRVAWAMGGLSTRKVLVKPYQPQPAIQPKQKGKRKAKKQKKVWKKRKNPAVRGTVSWLKLFFKRWVGLKKSNRVGSLRLFLNYIRGWLKLQRSEISLPPALWLRGTAIQTRLRWKVREFARATLGRVPYTYPKKTVRDRWGASGSRIRVLVKLRASVVALWNLWRRWSSMAKPYLISTRPDPTQRASVPWWKRKQPRKGTVGFWSKSKRRFRKLRRWPTSIPKVLRKLSSVRTRKARQKAAGAVLLSKLITKMVGRSIGFIRRSGRIRGAGKERRRFRLFHYKRSGDRRTRFIPWYKLKPPIQQLQKYAEQFGFGDWKHFPEQRPNRGFGLVVPRFKVHSTFPPWPRKSLLTKKKRGKRVRWMMVVRRGLARNRRYFWLKGAAVLGGKKKKLKSSVRKSGKVQYGLVVHYGGKKNIDRPLLPFVRVVMRRLTWRLALGANRIWRWKKGGAKRKKKPVIKKRLLRWFAGLSRNATLSRVTRLFYIRSVVQKGWNQALQTLSIRLKQLTQLRAKLSRLFLERASLLRAMPKRWIKKWENGKTVGWRLSKRLFTLVKKQKKVAKKQKRNFRRSVRRNRSLVGRKASFNKTKGGVKPIPRFSIRWKKNTKIGRQLCSLVFSLKRQWKREVAAVVRYLYRMARLKRRWGRVRKKLLLSVSRKVSFLKTKSRRKKKHYSRFKTKQFRCKPGLKERSVGRFHRRTRRGKIKVSRLLIKPFRSKNKLFSTARYKSPWRLARPLWAVKPLREVVRRAMEGSKSVIAGGGCVVGYRRLGAMMLYSWGLGVHKGESYRSEGVGKRKNMVLRSLYG